VAGDERGDERGDELFEDLDKFFAPIRDVDWDEPEEPAATAPAEEHVAVRTEEQTTVHIPDEAAETPAAEGAEEAESEPEPEEVWYDTGQLEEIDEAVGEPIHDTEGPADVDADEDRVERVPTASVADPTLTLDGLDEEEVVVRAPSDEALEAAADHFATSLPREESYPTEPVEVVISPTQHDTADNDILAQLGADDVEEELLSDLAEQPVPRTVVVGAEGYSGPSWQEPASVEVGPDIERRQGPSGDRDVPAAFMTGLILAGLAVITLWAGAVWFASFAALLVLVAQGELFGVLVKHHYRPAALIGLVAGALMMVGAYWRGESATPAMFALGVVATFLWYMTVPIEHRTNVVRDLGLTVLNMAWIPLLGGYLIATLKLPDGTSLVLWVILLTFLFDTAAFLIGSVSGGGWIQRPLAPNISPKKSWEGIIGGALATVIASVAFVSSFVEPFQDKKVDALLLGLVIAVAATFGDLAESVLKRDIGVKDMGTLLPGHGGVLDRIDSLLFVAPAAFLLFRVLFA
jgi:phosphatidate cytidylyltransferase